MQHQTAPTNIPLPESSRPSIASERSSTLLDHIVMPIDYGLELRVFWHDLYGNILAQLCDMVSTTDDPHFLAFYHWIEEKSRQNPSSRIEITDNTAVYEVPTHTHRHKLQEVSLIIAKVEEIKRQCQDRTIAPIFTTILESLRHKSQDLSTLTYSTNTSRLTSRNATPRHSRPPSPEPVPRPLDATLESVLIPPLRPLIVDDDKLVRMVHKRTITGFTEEGFTIGEAISGNSAFTILENNRDTYNIVLIDFSMQDGDGLELIDKIRKHSDPKIHQLTTILVSANTEDIDWEKHGFDGAIQKPLTKAKLESVLQKLNERISC